MLSLETDTETTKAENVTVTQDNQTSNVEEFDSLKNENNDTVKEDDTDTRGDPGSQFSNNIPNEESDVKDNSQHSEARANTSRCQTPI